MANKQASDYSRFWVKRYSKGEDLGNLMQQAIQEYIRRYEQMPFLVLVPQGLNLLPPISNLVIQQDERVLPYRIYFAVEEDES